MRILALDTATEACSVALLSAPAPAGGALVVARYEESGKSHAQQVLAMVESVLAEARITLSALDAIAVSVGPGAFTGVRISVAVAQGLAFGAGLPLVPVTTLEALAFQVVRRGASHAFACLDARMGEVYWGCFAADRDRGVAASGSASVGPPGSVVLPDGGHYRGIGRGLAAYPALAALPGLVVDPDDGRALPDAREIARLAALRLAQDGGQDPATVSPVYLRDKVALTEAERRQAGAP